MTNMCYHPWVGLDISAQGDFRPCCKYNGTFGLSLKEYENNPSLQKLQQDFLNGERPSGCQRCWSDEDSGLPSKRTIDNVYFFNDQVPDMKSYKVLSLPFGNTCNLTCITCNPESSSRWQKEWQTIHNVDILPYHFYKENFVHLNLHLFFDQNKFLIILS